MTDTRHTPGPWACEPMVGDTDAIWIGNADGYVAQITREDGLEACDWADARLIASAPDMLAALREAQEALDVLADDAADAGFPARAEAAAEMAMRFRAAIAKATGEDTTA